MARAFRYPCNDLLNRAKISREGAIAKLYGSPTHYPIALTIYPCAHAYGSGKSIIATWHMPTHWDPKTMLDDDAFQMAIDIFGPQGAREKLSSVLAEIGPLLDLSGSPMRQDQREDVANQLHQTLGPLGIFGAYHLYHALCSCEQSLRFLPPAAPQTETVWDNARTALEDVHQVLRAKDAKEKPLTKL